MRWKEPSTWQPPLSDWLVPHFRDGGLEALSQLPEQDLCWDDSDWLDEVLEPCLAQDIETVVEALATAIDRATLRVFHGCRVADASVFHQQGIKLGGAATLLAEVRTLVAEEDDLASMRPRLENILAGVDVDYEADQLFVVADDTFQLKYAGHYMLYGSEWILSLLGFGAHDVLRRRGVPTMVEIDLPMSRLTPGLRANFAEALLQEWVRLEVNGATFIPPLDFTIMLRAPVPAHQIVGHFHPEALRDPFHQNILRKTAVKTCPACA